VHGTMTPIAWGRCDCCPLNLGDHRNTVSPTVMAGKKSAPENSKKVAGNAKKAEAAAGKKAAEDQKKAAAESAEWKKGSKDDSKAYVMSTSSFKVVPNLLTPHPVRQQQQSKPKLLARRPRKMRF
jgi:hypothetical protein